VALHPDPTTQGCPQLKHRLVYAADGTYLGKDRDSAHKKVAQKTIKGEKI
jgi:hypothetical protein